MYKERTILVLGDMLELGKYKKKYHKAVDWEIVPSKDGKLIKKLMSLINRSGSKTCKMRIFKMIFKDVTFESCETDSRVEFDTRTRYF